MAKNTAILAIGQLSSKIFTFLLLPVYTSLLSPDDFGTIDALQTVISLALYFVTLQIENAVFRFIIENRTNKEKNMIVKITDKNLLKKTNGIVQGMSGCPIEQDGKIIGAVTHVLVNDPTTGYAVFGDLMIKQTRQIN